MDVSAMIPELLSALPLTLAITSTAMIAGFCLALIATTLRVRRIPVVSHLIDLYVSYARSVPVVLQLFVAFYGLPLLVALFGSEDFFSPTIAAMVGLSFYHGGYLSEVMRPAYLAVDRGQHPGIHLPSEDRSRRGSTSGALRLAGLRELHHLPYP